MQQLTKEEKIDLDKVYTTQVKSWLLQKPMLMPSSVSIAGFI